MSWFVDARRVVMESVPESESQSVFEAHRAIAREFHLSAQRAYTLGGGSALGGFLGVIAVGVVMGQATEPLPYVAAVMVGLVVLYFAKRLIDAHIYRLEWRLKAYCERNDIEFGGLIRYFASRDYNMLMALDSSLKLRQT